MTGVQTCALPIFLLSFLFLGQANVRSIPSVASSLELEDSEGECRSFLLCFLFFFNIYIYIYIYMPFPCLLLPLRSPLRLCLFSAVMLRFPHPFFNLLCALSQSLLRNQRSNMSRFRLRSPILVSPFPFFFFFYRLSLFSFLF